MQNWIILMNIYVTNNITSGLHKQMWLRQNIDIVVAPVSIKINDRLILITYQPVYVYFMTRLLGITFIIYLFYWILISILFQVIMSI